MNVQILKNLRESVKITQEWPLIPPKTSGTIPKNFDVFDFFCFFLTLGANPGVPWRPKADPYFWCIFYVFLMYLLYIFMYFICILIKNPIKHINKNVKKYPLGLNKTFLKHFLNTLCHQKWSGGFLRSGRRAAIHFWSHRCSKNVLKMFF